MQTKFKRLATALILAVGGPATASAASVTLYDNTSILTPDSGLTSFTTSTNYWGSNQFSTGTLCPLGCTLGTITLRLNVGGGQPGDLLIGPDKFYLSIYSNSNTPFLDIFGTVLSPVSTGTALTANGDISNPVGPIEPGYTPGYIEDTGTAPSLHYQFTPNVALTLDNDTSYWVKLTGLSSDHPVSWDILPNTDTGGTDGGIGFYSGGTVVHLAQHSFVMKVDATPVLASVPIPGAVWLMGSALVGFVGWGRRLQV
ncbi:MAG: hypothetical protein KDI74_07375 [Gammaproteobacteria bacterium]|nr:hypothetical protein [Gammaproteobacteria bacterium]